MKRARIHDQHAVEMSYISFMPHLIFFFLMTIAFSFASSRENEGIVILAILK